MRGKEALHEFDYGAVQLTGSGRMKEHYDRIHSHYLALDNDRLLKVFRQNAGLPAPGPDMGGWYDRSEEHTSELQSLMRNSYAVFCLKKKKQKSSKYTLR